MKARIDAILTGLAVPLADTPHQSGIHKTPVTTPLWLSVEGLAGDEQADRRVHGGPEKAVHHYPREHYHHWREHLGALPLLAAPGAFGENLSTTGLTEEHVCVGDIFELGEAVVQVSQGRQPCWKLNARLGHKGAARLMQDMGRTGWYYRVLEPGFVTAGDALTLIDRPEPDWTLSRLLGLLFRRDPGLAAEWAAAAELAPLAESWKRTFRRRLDTGAVEDWSKRLEG
ncbi:MOSC domain-containing protein [Vogesella fluminis]|uniref:Molybdenum cofactor sulfurase n=1 Tax=Vogesella fluminis TaxID=1069161 RepID=A0ABQ3H6L9_9NEIS|nr:MOSC domain-containing protein [Vogesella fluminis]GHD73272.1 molybdenum cofactor sulfurase [Vogesella fluminis]